MNGSSTSLINFATTIKCVVLPDKKLYLQVFSPVGKKRKLSDQDT